MAIKTAFNQDSVPWCAAFVGGVLEECGIKSTRSAAARSYLKWGRGIPAPVEGCIVIFWRGSPSGWSGHVGFVVGQDQAGNLMVLGGNQGDEVNIRPFPISRVLGYRWPEQAPMTGAMLAAALPTIKSDGQLSQGEA
jgi:uncharacterized protein (TIGR02594 family)